MKSIRMFIFLVALTFGGVANAQNAVMLRAICFSKSVEDDGFCRGYILALAQYLDRDAFEGEVKAPKNISMKELKDSYLKYTDANTDLAILPADISVYMALKKKYPCKSK